MIAAFDWFATNSNNILVVVTAVLAVAAVAQFELSRRTAQRQLRAYVYPDNAMIKSGDSYDPRCTLLIRNSGQTPARSVISWANMDVIEPRHEMTLEAEAPKRQSMASLGANSVITKQVRFRPLNEQEVLDIGNGTKGIYVYGAIHYEDVFRRQHRTNFCLVYFGTYPPPEDAILILANNGNRSN